MQKNPMYHPEIDKLPMSCFWFYSKFPILFQSLSHDLYTNCERTYVRTYVRCFAIVRLRVVASHVLAREMVEVCLKCDRAGSQFQLPEVQRGGRGLLLYVVIPGQRNEKIAVGEVEWGEDWRSPNIFSCKWITLSCLSSTIAPPLPLFSKYFIMTAEI